MPNDGAPKSQFVELPQSNLVDQVKESEAILTEDINASVVGRGEVSWRASL